MEALERLASIVARAFYSGQAVVVMDLLIPVHSMREDELATALKIKPKDVSKVCVRLKADNLVSTHSMLVEGPYSKASTTSSGKPFPPRKITKTFYFIDYKVLVDSVKYKIYRMGKRLEEETEIPSTTEYQCQVCRKKYDTMDMLLLDTDLQRLPLCEVCQNIVVPAGAAVSATSSETREGSSKYVRMMQEFESIIACLKATDALIIPEKVREFNVNSVMGVLPHSEDVEPGDRTIDHAEDDQAENDLSRVHIESVITTAIQSVDGAATKHLDPAIASYYASLLSEKPSAPSIPTGSKRPLDQNTEGENELEQGEEDDDDEVFVEV